MRTIGNHYRIGKQMYVVWSYFLKKVDVLFRMKPAHVMIRSTIGLVNLW